MESEKLFPEKLSTLASSSVIRLLVYEDYETCYFYRWDPVIIWQYQTHQPKKKKKETAVNPNYGHPPPPWKELLKLRNWWHEKSSEILGHVLESPLRQLLLDALERQSWTSQSEEEDLLFLLLKIIVDDQLYFYEPINESWLNDLGQILDNLGPYLIQKVMIENETFNGNTVMLAPILSHSPNLQVFRISQWELNNELLYILSTHCTLLQEFSIYDMEANVFMCQDAFVKCFFKGKSFQELRDYLPAYPKQLRYNNTEYDFPYISFPNLRYVDILLCGQMEELILMILYFYPNVVFSNFNMNHTSEMDQIFQQIMPKLSFKRLYGNLTEISKLDAYKIYVERLSGLTEIIVDLILDESVKDLYIENNGLKHIQEICSKNLLKIIDNENCSIDSIIIRPSSYTKMSIFLPTLYRHNSKIKSLHFVYDSSDPCLNSLYQLLNLCQQLERLVIEVNCEVRSTSSTAFRTELRELPALNTFIILDYHKEQPKNETSPEGVVNDTENAAQVDDEEEVEEKLVAFKTIFNDVICKAPNLMSISIEVCEEFQLSEISTENSESVEKLRAYFPKKTPHNFKSFTPSFPNLKTLYLKPSSDSDEKLCYTYFSNLGLKVSTKRADWANVFRWESRRHNFKYPYESYELFDTFVVS